MLNNGNRLSTQGTSATAVFRLNHPNIASIYGVEDRALVIELAPGPTLAERIAAERRGSSIAT